MKLALIALGILTAAAALGTPAEAQNYPWCAYLTGTGGAKNCGFVSFAQCMATAAGNGNDCRLNTQYDPPPGVHDMQSSPAPYRHHAPQKSHKNS
jgi:hypothetical protein